MADFEPAIEIVLDNEGGYVNDPKDPGGETKFGISKAAYPNVDIANLTVDQAKEIYRKDYWLFDGIYSQAVANKLMDAYVNKKHTAIRWAQEIVNTDVDGIYGPHTQALINAMDTAKFLTLFRQWWINYLAKEADENPNGIVAKDFKGLVKRARQ